MSNEKRDDKRERKFDWGTFFEVFTDALIWSLIWNVIAGE